MMTPFGVTGALQVTSNLCGSPLILETLLIFGLLGTAIVYIERKGNMLNLLVFPVIQYSLNSGLKGFM